MTQGHLDLRSAPRDRRGILLPDAGEFGQAMDETIQQVMQTLTAPAAPTAAPAGSDATPDPTPLDRAFAALGIGPDRTQRLLAAAVLCIASAALLSLVVLLGQRAAAPATPLPSAPAAATATRAPAAAAAPTASAATIPAFWAPGANPAPAVDPAAIEGASARYGDTWVRVQLVGGGTVWIAAGTLPAGVSATGVVDLAAPIVPTPAPYVPPRATDPPQPPCKTAGVGDKVVTVCGWGDLDALAQQQWLATYGGNVGQVGAPSPQPPVGGR